VKGWDQLFSSIGSIIIDDIVLPNGRTFMGTLGGGMTHAAMGMRVWTDSVRPISAIGNDFPEYLLAQMRELFDLSGIVRRDWMTTRAWQLFEENGHRSEVFRTPLDKFLAMGPRPHEVPLELLNLEGVHLQAGLAEEFYAWVERLRAAGCKFILWEPWEQFTKPENLDVYHEMVKLVDIVSPNLEEACTLTGLSDPLAVFRELRKNAPIVALRMGSQGSLVAQQGGPIYQVSTVPVPKIVDVTGAGNAYCGGLVVGMSTRGDLIQAAGYAVVSASMALGQFGAVYPIAGVHETAIQRLEQVKIVKVE
jgi:sugar/nucleoside kinase (ribokinase family)